MKTKFIALITDFGTDYPFVGTMKGVILSIAPNVTVIDITHHIPPQDILTASFYLMASLKYFPKSTLFIAVVDPFVGTERNILWAKTQNYQFICPDNGIISWVEEKEKIIESRAIKNSKLFLPDVSSTFHGRDIMAPVAASIAKGLPEKKLGPIFNKYVKTPFPHPHRIGNKISGHVIALDYFGNVITNIQQQHITQKSIFTISGKIISGLKQTYASVPEGEPLALIGSFGFLEFSIRNGNFAKTFNIKTGAEVEVLISIE